jgi:hypothetical protein
MRLALRRLTGIRQPENPGFHELLQLNQDHYLAKNQTFVENLAHMLLLRMKEYHGIVDECLEHIDDPHDKKVLRQQALELLLKESTICERVWIRNGRVTVKLKVPEIAKPGKYCRIVIDLGVAASLQGFRLTKLLKVALSVDYFSIPNGDMEFCLKPEPAVMADIFRKLISPINKYYFVYFSDDSVLSIRTPTGVHTYNMDIKSCDGSHGPQIFETLIALTPDPFKDDMRVLVEQCACKLEIRSSTHPNERVHLKPYSPRLYSGSTLTTLINNLANLIIAHSIMTSNAVTEDQIKTAANEAGYIVTLERCYDYSTIQFLKHSPVYDVKGELCALLNIGVILRMSGTCKGRLPGKGDYRERAMFFQQALLRGAAPRVHYPLIDAMKDSCSSATSKLTARTVLALQKQVDALLYLKTADDDSEHHFTSQEVFRRYLLDPCEIQTIVHQFGHLKFQQHLNSSAISKILLLDYGLDTRDFSLPV